MFHRVERAALPALCLLAMTIFFPSMKALALDSAWGPERETFTWDKPASYRTFNSMTNNPGLGDERNFVRVREAGSNAKYVDNITVEPGKEYEIYIYYHNNAAANLNKEGKGIAENVRVKTASPEKISAGQVAAVRGEISSTNANPTMVYDVTYLTAKETVYMRYVPNSAVLHNAGTANGSILDANALFGENGAKIAYWSDSWGIIPGCNEYAGYVTYRLKADKPNFTMDKKVSKDQANNYGDEITVAPGEVIDFQIAYKNSGTTDQKSVTVYDQMPTGLQYVEGTTFMVTPANGSGNFVSDKLFNGGLVIGDYHAGEGATITYKAKLSEDTTIFPCGSTVIYNNSSLATANGTIYDKAKITVVRNCGTTVTEIPETGPAEVVLAVVVISGIGIGAAYWIRSRAMLNKITKGETGGNASDK